MANINVNLIIDGKKYYIPITLENFKQTLNYINPPNGNEQEGMNQAIQHLITFFPIIE